MMYVCLDVNRVAQILTAGYRDL